MEDVFGVLENTLSHTPVVTYGQNGNVMFTSVTLGFVDVLLEKLKQFSTTAAK